MHVLPQLLLVAHNKNKTQETHDTESDMATTICESLSRQTQIANIPLHTHCTHVPPWLYALVNPFVATFLTRLMPFRKNCCIRLPNRKAALVSCTAVIDTSSRIRSTAAATDVREPQTLLLRPIMLCVCVCALHFTSLHKQRRYKIV